MKKIEASPPSPAQPHAALAHQRLEWLMVTLQLEPGRVLAEREVVELVGLGRTPVREAMQRLAWEGLVEIRPRSGIKIADTTPAEYVKVAELRLLLEPRLARAAARFATDSHREEIARARAEMIACMDRGDLRGYLGPDRDFDATMLDAAGDAFLANILRPLQTLARRYWYRYNARQGIDWSVTPHLEIMDAVAANDADAAEAAMRAMMETIAARARDLAS